MTQTLKVLQLSLYIALVVSCIAHTSFVSARHLHTNMSADIKFAVTDLNRSTISLMKYRDHISTPYSSLSKVSESLLAKKSSRKQGKASSAADAAKIAKQQYGGKVLSVNTTKSDDRIIYRVKLLLDNGRVRTVTISG